MQLLQEVKKDGGVSLKDIFISLRYDSFFLMLWTQLFGFCNPEPMRVLGFLILQNSCLSLKKRRIINPFTQVFGLQIPVKQSL